MYARPKRALGTGTVKKSNAIKKTADARSAFSLLVYFARLLAIQLLALKGRVVSDSFAAPRISSAVLLAPPLTTHSISLHADQMTTDAWLRSRRTSAWPSKKLINYIRKRKAPAFDAM